jgi:hypothetical protein
LERICAVHARGTILARVTGAFVYIYFTVSTEESDKTRAVVPRRARWADLRACTIVLTGLACALIYVKLAAITIVAFD